MQDSYLGLRCIGAKSATLFRLGMSGLTHKGLGCAVVLISTHIKLIACRLITVDAIKFGMYCTSCDTLAHIILRNFKAFRTFDPSFCGFICDAFINIMRVTKSNKPCILLSKNAAI